MNSISQSGSDQRSFATALPRWQLLIVLIGFPLCYLANSFTPWSIGLFGSSDRSWYIPFWCSILVLHWTTTAVMLTFVYRAGGTLGDLGLVLTPTRAVATLACFVFVGGGLLWLRTTWPMPSQPPSGWQIMYPFTWPERVLMLFGSWTAGICEELIYRGFAIRTLQNRGIRTWLAVLLAGLSFSLIHGIAGVIGLPIYLAFAVLFSLIFLWRGSLLTVIVLHTLFDMQMVLAA